MLPGAGDDPRGELVRPYAVTRGRTEPTRDIAIEAILVTTARGVQEAPFAGRHKQLIAQLCSNSPLSLAEISSHLRVPIGVARVLVADMAAEGLLAVYQQSEEEENQGERIEMLERILGALQRL
jgi:hypothetical protein